MTTVAYDADRMLMASDSGINDGVLAFDGQKIFVAPDGDLIGICGDCVDGILFAEWYQSGADRSNHPLLSPDSDMAAITMGKDGVHTWDRRFVPNRVHSKRYAIGTGNHAAIAAMLCGKTLEQAIEVACLVDKFNSGLPVQTAAYCPRAPKAAVRRKRGAKPTA